MCIFFTMHFMLRFVDKVLLSLLHICESILLGTFKYVVCQLVANPLNPYSSLYLELLRLPLLPLP